MAYNRTLAACCAAVSIPLIWACVHTPVAQPSATTSRCYALSFGPWSGDARSLDFYRPLPTRVALHDSLIVSDGSSQLRWAMRWPIDSLRRVASWEPYANGDSLAIHFPSWWSTGVAIGVPAEGDTLRGPAKVYVDHEPYSPPRSSVTALPIPCTADIGVLSPRAGPAPET